VQLARFEYWKLLQGIAVEDLVFLDESGVNLGFIRKCARAFGGNRAYSKTPTQRGRNVSVIGAISLKGLLAQWSCLGAVDALTFDAFIAQCKISSTSGSWPLLVKILSSELNLMSDVKKAS
jgi:hypothetical protein